MIAALLPLSLFPANRENYKKQAEWLKMVWCGFEPSNLLPLRFPCLREAVVRGLQSNIYVGMDMVNCRYRMRRYKEEDRGHLYGCETNKMHETRVLVK